MQAPDAGPPLTDSKAPTARNGVTLAASEAALTCAAAFGLIRLFDDRSVVPRVVLVAIAAHALAALCRRRRLGAGATLALATGGLVAVISWTLLAHTTAFGVPTSGTFHVGRQQLSEAWAMFGNVKAPAPALPGFVLALSIGVWWLAFLADTAAFRGSPSCRCRTTGSSGGPLRCGDPQPWPPPSTYESQVAAGGCLSPTA